MGRDADRAASEAIAKVGRSLTDEELLIAIILVGDVAEHRATFTTDDVAFEFASDVDARAVGFIMRSAANEGLHHADTRMAQEPSSQMPRAA